MTFLEKSRDLLEGLSEKAQQVLSRRGVLSLTFVGAISGATLGGCEPTGVQPQCQEAYDKCNQKYLECIFNTPAADQDKKCTPIEDLCTNQASICGMNNSETASDSENTSTTGAPTTTSSKGETTASTDTPTTGGGSGGGSGGTTDVGTTGGETCLPPNCGGSECRPGEIGSSCTTIINGDPYVGIVGCDGDCYIHSGVNFDENGDGIADDPNYDEASWCDDICDNYSGYNKFYCPTFYFDGGACDEPNNNGGSEK